MAWIRRLPSGKWAATVYTPAGRRTWTNPLRSLVKDWADEQERGTKAGDWIDPREGETTVGEWWERCRGARHLELASRKRDESHWRNHVAPQWATVKLSAILTTDVEAWVVKMQRAKVGAATIQGALGVLRGLGQQAVKAKKLKFNPCAGVQAPRRAAHLDRVLTPDEDELLLGRLDKLFPGRADARLFVEMMLYCGCRYEEAAALNRDLLDTRRHLIHIGPVLERDGTIRPYPKSAAGARTVPVDEDLWPRLREHALTVSAGQLLFTAPRGGPLHYSSWHDRVWQRALSGMLPPDWSGFTEWLDAGIARLGLENDKELARAAGINPSLISNWRSGRFRPGPANLVRLERVLGPAPAAFSARSEPLLADPQPTPHDLRHTYGTRLGEGGVPVHEIMALMGHENLESAQRYLHAGEDRFDRARKATKAARRTVSSP